jgi:type I restriction enzyme S subunit
MLSNQPDGWGVIKIPEVLFFQEGPGVRKWQFHDSGVKLLNVGNINNGKINLSATKVHLSKEEAYGKYSHFLVDDGDLLIACSGIVVDNFHNKIAFISKEDLPLCLNTSTMRFKVLDEEVINLNFFKYFLQTNHFTKQLRKLITGSAQLNFGPSHIKKIDVFLPPLEEQKKIAAILDAADALRQKDAQLIAKYNALSQSLFLDMFGDPVTNPMRWSFREIKDVMDGKACNGFFAKKEHYTDIGTPIVWITDFINKNYVETSNLRRVSIDSNSIVKYRLCYGDVLFCRSSLTVEGIGKCSIVPKSIAEDILFECHIIKVRMGTNVAPEYFRYLSNTPYFRGQIMKNAKTSTMTTIAQEGIVHIKIPLPPVSLQNQFAERIQHIEAQKQQAQATLQKSEDLFNSLLQRAFKGELTA